MTNDSTVIVTDQASVVELAPAPELPASTTSVAFGDGETILTWGDGTEVIFGTEAS